jgi:hypothetical protein
MNDIIDTQLSDLHILLIDNIKLRDDLTKSIKYVKSVPSTINDNHNVIIQSEQKLENVLVTINDIEKQIKKLNIQKERLHSISMYKPSEYGGKKRKSKKSKKSKNSNF